MSDRETDIDTQARTAGDPADAGGAGEPTGSEGMTESAEPTGSDEAAGSGGRFGTDAPVTYLTWAAVAVLAVTALVALFGFYTGVSRIISVWVSRPYRPVVNAAFNLALLLSALGGIGLLLRGRD